MERYWIAIYFLSAIVASASACGGTINFQYSTSYTLSTPGFPSSSYPNSACVWNVETPAYHSVQVVVGSVNLLGNSAPSGCTMSDKVEFVLPTGSIVGTVCTSHQPVNTIDKSKFSVRFQPRGLAEVNGGVYGFSIELRAVPYYNLECKTDGFKLTMPFSKLQNPALYPHDTYQLSDSGCRATVLADRVEFTGGYSTCGSVSDAAAGGISNVVLMVPKPPPAPPRPVVRLPFLCKFPREDLIVSTDYDPLAILPFWAGRSLFPRYSTKSNRITNTRANLAQLESEIDFNIRLNVFNNDEFHPLGEPSMWRPSDVFFEVEALAAAPEFKVAAEECWYTATAAADDLENRYTFLHGGCPTDTDPIERYPSSNHHDRFAHTLGLSLPGSATGHHFVHCRVKICNANDPSTCTKDCVTPPPPTTAASPIPPGTLSGVIKDAVTMDEISGVRIFVQQSWTEIGTTLSATNGQYSLSLPPAADYAVTFQTPGYHSATMSGVQVFSGENTILEALLFIDVSYVGVGTASGTTKNAYSGAVESGVTLEFRSGINVLSGVIQASAVSDSNGYWEVTSLSTGHYTAVMSKPGFTNNHLTVIVLGGQRKDNQNGVISPIVAAGKIRVVLSWGTNDPRDLDSHMTGPVSGSSSRFHVSYQGKGSDTSSPFVSLDTDITTGYGPETITINQQTTGTYRYSIQDYTYRGSASSVKMGNSGAVVRVLFGDSSTPARTFNVPNSPGTLWTVFELNGDSITPINRMTYHEDPASIT
ncbi:uncharacterized protein LOC129591421 [Paramacrobiotus metropolitanus]|uniref:uncharacterized protein LOC129591421 n=1 Tax=Paramacrobiotus metropolitanus TaxID=2943436 RepID=UPI002445C760|nr:uncharacterized protein LOC129591421 [Paramacrobiotus metropolitanus]